jgi:hydrogenase maturation protease
MGDEGVEVDAIKRLESVGIPEGVVLLDGGTGGFHRLSLFEEHECIIMIDATMDGKPPGTISLLEPRFASDFPRSLSAHDIGLRDLIESAALLRSPPRIHLITVTIDSLSSMTTELSLAVAHTLPGVVEAVLRLVEAGAGRNHQNM